MFEYEKIAIGGVALVWLLPRLVEFLKVLGLQGKARIWAVVFALGGGLAGLAATINQGLFPQAALPWVNVAMWVLGGGAAACAAIGDYHLTNGV